MAYESELSRKYPCKFCGALPFIAGAHHKRDCLRWISEQCQQGDSTDHKEAEQHSSGCLGIVAGSSESK
jgi:hypothetical protein